MCYKGKCYLRRPPVEKSCLVLAILSAIANALLLLASVVMGCVIFASPVPEPASSSVSHILGDILFGIAQLAAVVILSIVGVASLISFIFSVLLCNGIYNRRPGLVKSYFIYGVVITVLTVVFSLLLIADEPTYGVLGLVGCVIYSLFLVLVHKTHSKLCADAGIKEHIRLVEDYGLGLPCENEKY